MFLPAKTKRASQRSGKGLSHLHPLTDGDPSPPYGCLICKPTDRFHVLFLAVLENCEASHTLQLPDSSLRNATAARMDE